MKKGAKPACPTTCRAFSPPLFHLTALVTSTVPPWLLSGSLLPLRQSKGLNDSVCRIRATATRGAIMPALQDSPERKRLHGLYEGLRLKLLDLSRKNQLLNYSLRPRSKRFLQLVGCSLEDTYKRLAVDEHVLKINALPEPDSIPEDERTEEFRAALERAKSDYIA